MTLSLQIHDCMKKKTTSIVYILEIIFTVYTQVQYSILDSLRWNSIINQLPY